MPDSRTHRAISTAGGFGLGLYMARNRPADVACARISGAVLGAVVGGALPDVIEPGLHSWHRKTAHSVAVGGGLAWLGLDPPGEFRSVIDQWDEGARLLRERRQALPLDHPDRCGLWLKEMGTHVLISLLGGLLLGYVLHLAADATTPRGLPLV